MTMKGTFRVLVAIAALAAGVSTAEATETTPDTHEIRVINDYATPVEVYLEDAKGNLHALGRVADAEFKVLEVADDVVAMGDFHLKIYPEARMGTMVDATSGIRSVELRLDHGDAVNVWLGTELARSQIESVPNRLGPSSLVAPDHDPIHHGARTL